MSVWAVAAVSARALAEAAALDGHRVAALDLFGDLDTRRAAQRWLPIGTAGGLQIDGARVLDALRELARGVGADAVLGWVPGSGLEGLPDVLEAGAALLPLVGTPPAAVRRVRDPREFFATLDTLGIGHPPVRFEPPDDPVGWLLKDAHGSGGWHIRHAAADRVADAGTTTGASMHMSASTHTSTSTSAAPRPDPSLYFQREMAGVPMSATFIADGAGVQVLGLNELIVQPWGERPHVYAGCIGPVAVADATAATIDTAVRRLTRAFGLRGWCSLDFIRAADDTIGVLEINPRPPASLALYAQRGLFDAHLRACGQAQLPPADAFAVRHVAGTQIVFARRPLRWSVANAQRLAGRADVHDLPAAGARFEPGDPVCSVGARGASALQVAARLAAACDDLTRTLETSR